MILFRADVFNCMQSAVVAAKNCGEIRFGGANVNLSGNGPRDSFPPWGSIRMNIPKIVGDLCVRIIYSNSKITGIDLPLIKLAIVGQLDLGLWFAYCNISGQAQFLWKISRVCQSVATPLSLAYPLSVFYTNSTLKPRRIPTISFE